MQGQETNLKKKKKQESGDLKRFESIKWDFRRLIKSNFAHICNSDVYEKVFSDFGQTLDISVNLHLYF